NDRLRMENVYFRNQLATAEHARALILFQQQTPSKTVAARVIGNSTVATAKAVFIDRGSTSGIEREMAVVTPEGIVGKVVAVYPLVSQVLLVTDPTFKVGVESQKGHIHGVLDCGSGKCVVEQIQNEDKVDVGEWFFTSGEDRIFPKGFPVGRVVAAEPGQGTKNVALNLSGAPGGAEEVLVVLKGIHQPIPAAAVPDDTPVTTLMPPTPELETGGAEAPKGQTQADKIVQKYAEIGKQENHVFGGVGSAIPNFNAKPVSAPKPTAAPVAAAPASRQAPTTAPTTPSRPGILGARPNAPAVGPNTKPEPVLPLGAPRRKPPAGQPPQQQ